VLEVTDCAPGNYYYTFKAVLPITFSWCIECIGSLHSLHQYNHEFLFINASRPDSIVRDKYALKVKNIGTTSPSEDEAVYVNVLHIGY
jgi:hypothetical protein